MKNKRRFLREAMGAGYSFGGGSFPTNRGGFGSGSGNLGGTGGAMYVYSILPLNKSLQPLIINSEDGEEEIHVGHKITGKKFGGKDKKRYTGTLLKIVKTEEGSLKYFLILDQNSSLKIMIDPTTAKLVKPEPFKVKMLDIEGGDQAEMNKRMSEGFYPNL